MDETQRTGTCLLNDDTQCIVFPTQPESAAAEAAGIELRKNKTVRRGGFSIITISQIYQLIDETQRTGTCLLNDDTQCIVFPTQPESAVAEAVGIELQKNKTVLTVYEKEEQYTLFKLLNPNSNNFNTRNIFLMS